MNKEEQQAFDKYMKAIKELQQENQLLKEQVDYLRRSIERKEETIIELEHERECLMKMNMLKNESAKLLTVITHEQMEQMAYKVGE